MHKRDTFFEINMISEQKRLSSKIVSVDVNKECRTKSIVPIE